MNHATGRSSKLVASRRPHRSAAGRQAPPLSLSQETVTASVGALRMLHEHKALFPANALALHFSGTSTLEAAPGAPQPASATVGAAAVLGILKCLPYELPMLTVAPVDADQNGLDAPSRRHGFVAAPGKLKNRCTS